MNSPFDRLRNLTIPFAGGSLSLGAWIITLIALVSSTLVALRPEGHGHGLIMWTRARNHLLLYEPAARQWNAEASHHQPVQLFLMSDQAIERRMLSGFLSETHVADLIELERNNVGRVFSGPLEDVGFVDLTERIEAEGLSRQINEPSFGPWSSRGHVFGLPHDVHPVLLAYRADLVEAQGIDISAAVTWDDFARTLRPMVRDLDGDGRPDRYLLNYWHTNMDQTELLMLQAGGAYFDDQGRPVIDSEVNARTAARLITWVCGPDRIAIDAPEFSASGNRLRLEGTVICSLVPDWLCGVWQDELPGLAGKMKLMPLPAWQPGGRRTSTWGGSMLGIARTTPHFEDAWTFAKHLYMSPQIAEQLYKTTGIVSPVKSLWPSTFYDEPRSYFCGQAPGRMYLQLAPDVPRRTSSPFLMLAKNHVRDALTDLRRYASANEQFEPAALEAEAKRLLTQAQARLQQQMARNVFVSEVDR
jgi:arabinosaccharide transport system substrate-binding protein